MRDPFVHRVLVAVGITTASLLLVIIVWRAITVLLLVFAGIIFAILLAWLREQLSHYLRLSRGFALAIVVLVVLLLFSLLVTLITPLIVDQIQALADELPGYIESVEDYLRRFNWGRALLAQAPEVNHAFGNFENFNGDLIARMVGIFSTTFGFIAGVVLILFIAIYLAAEPSLYVHGVLRLIPLAHRARGKEVLAQLGYTIRWWMLGQMLSMSILGTLTAIGLAVLGIPYALALGLLAAVMTFIPNLGPILAFIPTILVALAVSPEHALYVLVLYVIIQNVEGYFITPLVHRRIIAMPPVIILTVQILLLTMVGFIGVLLALPLVACAMVLIRMLYIEDVLGDDLNRPV
ncbi:hypothetical protein CAI21_16845 [Alkalilimnicola ehrlichii]|uniref:AI-2E family transporter n=1 Tax=Alkalilimnicola ehrlichii TaxID=351052 RepID=A0A3E0WNA1_9GAMM|nr:AI-2E family transporter [Alkalilimnicola ehrlichii]RFA26360.1 hypothetical protein CAI21_16845 [Alkalilimnicola ehrlichii]RFA33425.1 hypothetical protein CAL65_17330 [Alkalilimnicola ehrlichii]